MSLRLEFCWEVIQRVFMTLYIKYSKEVTHRFVEWINGRRITAVNFPSKYVLNLMPIIPMLFIISKILTSNKMLLHWNIDFVGVFFPNSILIVCPILTNIKSLCYIAGWWSCEFIFVFIRNEFTDTSRHTAGNGEPFR